MFSNQPSQGVTIPQGQLSSGRGEPNTIKHAVAMVPYAIQYFDEHGEAHNTVAYKVGDIVYMDMGAERWASNLKQASDFIKEAVLDMAANNSDVSLPVPDKDAVDVVSAEVGDNARDSATPE